MYCIESVKTSCWYREFLQPGPVRDFTHELSSLDRFLEFCDFFCMPLTKVKELADVFIRRGYLRMPRSLSRGLSFMKGLSSLYCLHCIFWGRGLASDLSHVDTYFHVRSAQVLL
jgi:hypothetical protein